MEKKMKHAPRGWNSWDCYGAAVDEATVRRNAEYMSMHMKDAGYEYVVVDIQWYEPLAKSNEYHPFADLCMDNYGRLIPADNRFPSSESGLGFKSLADYVHSLGLKFGIHIMRGIPRQAVVENTQILGTDYYARDIAKLDSICSWNTDMYGVDPSKPGAKEYYESLFALYKSWEVDFIKLDDICRELPKEEEELILISECLKNCGRDMIFSLSPGPALLEKAELYKHIANMWRITDDFWDDWKLLYAMFERAEKWCVHAGYNYFPDADMLPVGAIRQCYDLEARTKFTEDEIETMMILWSIMRSPLIVGSELTKLDQKTFLLLTDNGLMEMHENSRNAHQLCRRKIADNEVAVWIANSRKGGYYVALFNLDGPARKIRIPLEKLELEDTVKGIRLIRNKEVSFEKDIYVSLKEHGACAFYLKEE